MSRRILFPASALLAALVLYVLDDGQRGGGAVRPSEPGAAPADTRQPSAPALLDAPTSLAPTRDAAVPRITPHPAVGVPAPEKAEETSANALSAWTARGIVLDPSGAPLVGIEVVASPVRSTVMAETRSTVMAETRSTVMAETRSTVMAETRSTVMAETRGDGGFEA